MKDKYVALLAEVDKKHINDYKRESYADIPASGAIFFAIVGGSLPMESALTEETGLPAEQVKRILDRLVAAGYIVDSKIKLNLPELNEESIMKEYTLFSMAGGTGVINKI
jgi:hypothetical protein